MKLPTALLNFEQEFTCLSSRLFKKMMVTKHMLYFSLTCELDLVDSFTCSVNQQDFLNVVSPVLSDGNAVGCFPLT